MPFRSSSLSREYGSGGLTLGRKLATRLGVDYYDHDIIDATAERLGYSTDFVRENEQNISNAKLWELIFTDKSIPLSMNPPTTMPSSSARAALSAISLRKSPVSSSAAAPTGYCATTTRLSACLSRRTARMPYGA